MSRTIQSCLSGPWHPTLYTTPDKFLHDSLGGLWPAHLERRSQGRGGLTQRLEKGLRETPNGKVIFIGSDAPGVSPALLRKASRMLNRHNAIFGPATDGGFWLFGLNKTSMTRSPFQNCRWSTEFAMQDVRSNLPARYKIGYLPTLIDIDTAEDWKNWLDQPKV